MFANIELMPELDSADRALKPRIVYVGWPRCGWVAGPYTMCVGNMLKSIQGTN